MAHSGPRAGARDKQGGVTDAERVVDLYRRHAAAWALARGASFAERGWLERFSARLDTAAAMLDIGYGSGQPIASFLAGQGYRVTGIDGSPEMVALFRAHLPG
jgi:2-polyprenyl-3-methyl-5-hydroxy-6-metoxy-1,4-benzoquinol methylase